MASYFQKVNLVLYCACGSNFSSGERTLGRHRDPAEVPVRLAAPEYDSIEGVQKTDGDRRKWKLWTGTIKDVACCIIYLMVFVKFVCFFLNVIASAIIFNVTGISKLRR